MMTWIAIVILFVIVMVLVDDVEKLHARVALLEQGR